MTIPTHLCALFAKSYSEAFLLVARSYNALTVHDTLSVDSLSGSAHSTTWSMSCRPCDSFSTSAPPSSAESSLVRTLAHSSRSWRLTLVCYLPI